jgi:V/A-type H+-transporting ATPase subunit D
MRRTDVPATKSSLLRMRESLEIVRAGHDLLDQKRQVLLEELIDQHRETGQLRRQVHTALASVYAAFREGLLAGGRPPLDAEGLAATASGYGSLRLRERSVMGVILPLLSLEGTDVHEPLLAPGWAPPAAARVRREIRDLVDRLAHLAEIEVSCRRLATELKRTQRRVNALEQVFLPEYRDTIRFVESTLEEREREELFHRKRAKAASRESRPGG